MIICTDPDDVPVDLSTPEDEPVAMIRQFQGDRYVTTASIALSNGKFRVETLTSSHTGANLTELIGEVFGISDVAATIEGYRIPDHDYLPQWQGCVPFRGRLDGDLTEISLVATFDDDQYVIETYVHRIHALFRVPPQLGSAGLLYLGCSISELWLRIVHCRSCKRRDANGLKFSKHKP